ncbi:hypothetical protein DPX39_010049100 [Trypanosoma brucei equiperdum]|uniref:Uncharacterized protein n=1 Tax=Trypanosoma brucei equiperdum TaxID=630700 RepID=A0A3L6LCW7_9TRYP|nr:hypothetical protein DPX39_010049100 [Trypanosoma brucei equiperdum]
MVTKHLVAKLPM